MVSLIGWGTNAGTSVKVIGAPYKANPKIYHPPQTQTGDYGKEKGRQDQNWGLIILFKVY